MPILSQTAEFMALFRALETRRRGGERLFEDPYAVEFLRPSLRGLVWLAGSRPLHGLICALVDGFAPGARTAGVARTRLFDDATAEALENGIEQVVILGVGFDCRAHRLPALADVRVFEADRPAMLAERARCLSRGGVRRLASRVPVPIDFAGEPLPEVLERAGFEPRRRSLFLLEGVTNYLTREAVDRLLGYVGSAARGSRLLFTYVHRDALEHPERFATTRLLRPALRRFGERWTFGLHPAELAEIVAQAALELVWDEGSTEYRARYLGPGPRALRGYEFYRAALARVP